MAETDVNSGRVLITLFRSEVTYRDNGELKKGWTIGPFAKATFLDTGEVTWVPSPIASEVLTPDGADGASIETVLFDFERFDHQAHQAGSSEAVQAGRPSAGRW